VACLEEGLQEVEEGGLEEELVHQKLVAFLWVCPSVDVVLLTFFQAYSVPLHLPPLALVKAAFLSQNYLPPLVD